MADAVTVFRIGGVTHGPVGGADDPRPRGGGGCDRRGGGSAASGNGGRGSWGRAGFLI